MSKTITKTLRFLALLSIVHFQFSIAAPPALAAERTITIGPPTHELEIAKGQTRKTTLTVTNNGSKLVALEAFIRDFVAGPTGDAPRILGEDETSAYSLKPWLLLSDKQFVLQPGEQRQVLVTIVVPQDAEAGGRYGLVGFAEANSDIGEGVAVKPAVAALFLVTVPGEIDLAASIIRFTGPSLSTQSRIPLSLTLGNGGNVHVRPTGFIRISNLLGRQVAELPLNSEQAAVLPDSQRVFTSEWGTGGSFGLYRARATVTLPENGQTLLATPLTLWVFPIRTVGIGILALLILVLIAYEIEHLRLARRAVKEKGA